MEEKDMEDKTVAAGSSDVPAGIDPETSTPPVPSERGSGSATGEALEADGGQCNCPLKFYLRPGQDSQRIGAWMHRRAPRECAEKPILRSPERPRFRQPGMYFKQSPRITPRHCCQSFTDQNHTDDCDMPKIRIDADRYLGRTTLNPRVEYMPPPFNPVQYKAELKRDMDRTAEEVADPVQAALQIAVGAASVCWSNGGSGGVFLQDRAIVIAEAVREWIRDAVADGRAQL